MHHELLLHLNLIPGIGPATIERIFRHHSNGAGFSLHDLSVADLGERYQISSAIAQKLIAGLRDQSLLAHELEALEKHDISYISILDTAYPALLKEIHLPPPILYYQGVLPMHEKLLAIVGSRKADNYGQQCIAQLVPSLVEHGWAVVSGGAVGADTMAHTQALAHHGATIAVLGSGLLVPYPASNKKLFSSIVEHGGAVVSQFPLRTGPTAGNFPARNRIISGMSRGCIVVQAQEQSGASITAQFALQQGRELFAIPGPIDAELSLGCHRLIQQGAKLVQSVSDVLEEFGEVHEQISIQTSIIESRGIREQIGDSELPLDQKIIKHCKKPTSIDELAQLTGMDLAPLYGLLFDLQLAGKVYQNAAGLFETVF